SSNEGTSSRKRKNIDDFPQSMQFYKWARLDKVSYDIIKRLQEICFSEPIGVSDIIYKLIQYIRSQRAKEREYKENLKLERDGKDKKPSSAGETSSVKVKPSSKAVPSTPGEASNCDDEVQILLERRREILEEIGEGNDGEEESDSDVAENSKGDDERVNDAKDSLQENETPASNQEPINIPAASALPPPPTVTIKEEPIDEQVVASIPTVTVIPTTSAAAHPAPAAPTALALPIKPESQPAVTPSSTHSIESPASAQSTIAVADEPLSTYASKKAVKTEQLVTSPATIPPARPMTKQTIISATAAPFPVMQLQLVAVPPLAAVSVVQPRAAAEVPKPQQRPMQPVKREHAAPRIQLDPVEGKILSTNLVALNAQVDYLNKIKYLASAQKLPCEFFYKSIERFADPSPRFTVKYFKTLRNYIANIASQAETELNQFDQPSIAPLKITVQSVKTEIDAIFERVRNALAEHRATKAAEALQQEVQQSQQTQQQQRTRKSRWDNNTKETWQPLKQKRPHPDAEATNDKQQPVPKRIKKPLLETPVARIDSAAHPGQDNDPLRNATVPAEATLGACGFCSGSHNPIKCHVYKGPDAREQRRAALNLCFSCLRPFKRGHKCSLYRKWCSHCKGHQSHTALCRWLHKKPRTERPRPPFTRDETREEFDDADADFSPSTPIYEEEGG
ncbi:hypothetical protein PMAYCL1PPCAC_13074, partial [Pristionchus mayeri]